MTHSIPNFGTLTDNFRSVTRPRGRNKKFLNFFLNEIGPSADPRTEEKQKRSKHVRGIAYFQSYKHRDFLIFRDKVSDKEFSYRDFFKIKN